MAKSCLGREESVSELWGGFRDGSMEDHGLALRVGIIVIAIVHRLTLGLNLCSVGESNETMMNDQKSCLYKTHISFHFQSSGAHK